MPTLIRFVLILAALAGAAYAALFALAHGVKIEPHEIVERIDLSKTAK